MSSSKAGGGLVGTTARSGCESDSRTDRGASSPQEDKAAAVSFVEEVDEEDANNDTEVSYGDEDGDEDGDEQNGNAGDDDEYNGDDASTQNSSPSAPPFMPLFHYRRVSGPLRSNPGRDCTAAAMGRVVLNSDTTPGENDSSQFPPPSASGGMATSSSSSSAAAALTRSWYHSEMSLAAYGFETGSVVVADASSSMSAVTVLLPTMSRTQASSKVVGLSWDATGTQLGVLYQDRVVTVCADLKYAVLMRPLPRETNDPSAAAAPAPASTTVEGTPPPQSASSSSQAPAPRPNAFSSFMSAITGRSSSAPPQPPASAAAATQPPPAPASSETPRNQEPPNVAAQSDASAETAASLAPALTVVTSQVQYHRITYPESFGRPTCFAIDPAYKRRQNVVVGFADGRLVYTRRGFFRQRQDTVVYQGAVQEIQAVAWRGTLLAIADASGIRLVDFETMARIAHVDRPTGARPGLYPSISDLRPVMAWETSYNLLVAWGDCLLSLQVRDQASTAAAANHFRSLSGESSLISDAGGASPSAPAVVATSSSTAPTIGAQGDVVSSSPSTEHPPLSSPPTATLSPRRRTVECTMAWQLDCIATGVAPLDGEHVVVLGLVPPAFDEDPLDCIALKNDLELQVLARANGEVRYADLIPVVRQETNVNVDGSAMVPEVASSFRLISSFAAPRMDDASEAMALDALRAESGELVFGDGGDFGEPAMPLSLFSVDAASRRTGFRDSHLRWNMSMASFDISQLEQRVAHHDFEDEDDDDADSVDSDDYGLIFHSSESTKNEESSNYLDKFALPPMLVVVAPRDAIQVRVRGVDDAIAFALSERKAGLALFWGIRHRRQLRKYTVSDLVNAWFQSVLRLRLSDSVKPGQTTPGTPDGTSTHLSLRRMKLAAEAMPVLLGGDVDLWCRWIKQMEKIPGALFIARRALPVRDPVLPSDVYASVLENMLVQIESMPQSSRDNTMVNRLLLEAEGHFLNTLLGWGSIPVLQEFIKLYKSQCVHDPHFLTASLVLEENLSRRRAQSSTCYLQFHAESSPSANRSTLPPDPVVEAVKEGSLFDIENVLSIVSKRFNVFPTASKRMGKHDGEQVEKQTRVCLEAAATLHMMKGSFDESLRLSLLIGIQYPIKKLDEIESDAIQAVNVGVDGFLPASRESDRRRTSHSHFHVLNIIESHHLHQCLLNDRFLFHDDDFPPLFALAQLVGLNILGDFLVTHCTAPQHPREGDTVASTSSHMESSSGGERRGTLPLDLVAQQLEGSPKLLHWYLHLVFVRKPSAYVLFPSTANPPPILNLLHRKHLDLYLRFADSYRDSSLVFAGVEAYRVLDKTTPLLSFLKVVMQLGGIQPMEIAKLLQAERNKGGSSSIVSRSFALELAYILENFGNDGSDETSLILDLYLQGCRSLMLAVSYAQRTPARSQKLWESLIDYCLSEKHQELPIQSFAQTRRKSSGKTSKVDGSLFGSLLEAAALSGADLAHLVQQIPPGMSIEGLRPRLVSAVADSRFKVQMRELAREIAAWERRLLVRELEHRSRRGIRYFNPNQENDALRRRRLRCAVPSSWEATNAAAAPRSAASTAVLSPAQGLGRARTTAPRSDRHQPSLTIPIR